MTAPLRLRSGDLFWRDSGGEVVALDADASRYFSANPTASVLWKRLEQGATEDELVEALRERYGVAHEVATTDVAAFVAELRGRGLLEN
jgi:hypothetical protein